MGVARFCFRFLFVVVLLSSILLGFLHQQYSGPISPVDTTLIEKDGGKWIKLKDGRILEYFEAGSSSSDRVVIIIHGFLMTGRSPSQLCQIEDNFKSHDIRVLSPSIPGFGYSSPHSNRTLISFANDIKELVDHLNIKEFTVIGMSMGGPHAATVAHHLGNQVTGLALLVSLSEKHVKNPTFLPDALADILSSIFKVISYGAYHSRILTPERWEYAFHSIFPVDWDDANGSHRHIFAVDVMRSCAHSFAGLEADIKLAIQPLPFPMEELTNGGKRKVFVHTGTLDHLVKPSSQHFLRDSIPGSVYEEGEHGHLYILRKPEHLLDIAKKLF